MLKNKSGFSLIEIIIVVIVISVLASLSIPRYGAVLEKTRSGEGVQILESLRKAQWGFYYENNSTYSAVLGDLDVTIPALDNFNAPTVSAAATALATLVRTNNAYTLAIQDDGDIVCTEGLAGICSKMGF